MTTTVIVALLLAVLTTTVSASNGVLSLGDYENCIGTELNTDIAVEMCHRLQESSTGKTSLGRSICVRTTRCRMIEMYGLEGKPEDGVHIPSPCVLPVNPTEKDEHKCAGNFTGRAHGHYELCVNTVDAACSKVSNAVLHKNTLDANKRMGELTVGYNNVERFMTSMNKSVAGMNNDVQALRTEVRQTEINSAQRNAELSTNLAKMHNDHTQDLLEFSQEQRGQYTMLKGAVDLANGKIDDALEWKTYALYACLGYILLHLLQIAAAYSQRQTLVLHQQALNPEERRLEPEAFLKEMGALLKKDGRLREALYNAVEAERAIKNPRSRTLRSVPY